jgi:nucleotidyltransferase substrate binding protein (TIGR01987 family)
MAIPDIRWQQRFSNFGKALAKLDEAARKMKNEYSEKDGRINDSFLDDILKEGLIQRFEYTHELAWNVIKDFLEDAGNANIYGSRDATRAAFAAGLIAEGEVWMDMIKSRNQTSHTYNEATADAIYAKIITEYHPAFLAFRDTMDALRT